MVEQGHDVDTDARVDDPAAPVEQAPAGATTLADRLLDGAGTGILALDHQGVVRFLNASVRVLLPGQRVGELLVGALDLGHDGRAASEEVELTVTGRRLRAHRRDLPDGWAAWYVDDVTEQHARMDSLLAERSRSRFLASASRRLGLSLHPGRTARTVVELAAAELAHAVAVVWPSSAVASRSRTSARGSRWPLRRSTPGRRARPGCCAATWCSRRCRTCPA